MHTLFYEHFEPKPIEGDGCLGVGNPLSTTSCGEGQLRRTIFPGSAGNRLTKWAEQRCAEQADGLGPARVIATGPPSNTHGRGRQKKHDRSSPYRALAAHKTSAFQHDEIAIIGAQKLPDEGVLAPAWSVHEGRNVGLSCASMTVMESQHSDVFFLSDEEAAEVFKRKPRATSSKRSPADVHGVVPQKSSDIAEEWLVPYCELSAEQKYDRDTYWYEHGALRLPRRDRRVGAVIAYCKDGGICQICGQRVDIALLPPHPGSASADHIDGMKWGSGFKAELHVIRNVACSHLRCNMVRQDTAHNQIPVQSRGGWYKWPRGQDWTLGRPPSTN